MGVGPPSGVDFNRARKYHYCTWYNLHVETYHIRTEGFEGPLDLLLSLIEKRKLLINDIALADVADDYLKHLENEEELPVAQTAQFVLVGSTLLLIKSKSLLPVLELTQEEQESIVDLEKRLKIYDRYKTIARSLVDVYCKKPLFPRNKVRRRHIEFAPDKNVTRDNMLLSMQSVVNNLPKLAPKLPKTVVEKVISLEEMMDELSARINSSMQVSFRQFSSNVPGGKMNVIVSFLAMLELVRQGIVRVEQYEKFDDIQMHSDNVGMPRYN